MDISKIVALQKEFDEKHGWSHNSSSTSEKIDFINKDIIGLVGEIGEFSNLIKKLNLLDNRFLDEELNEKFIELHPELQEELIDAFIYLIRISSHLDMDISKEYLRKYNINKGRFKKYENK
ncbi:hypothetical protein [Cytobacillus oceanisediminis]|uniref:hypothetical protein n=1 Tax=Cytobacillus oceanisediminis TaxID=665099 RepID=UPI001C246344|nr:hypothetical protein [Cytobacillus oceanisediminis]MBU8768714.1 hypothetical protein [Cytobacillus oceanisediminis]